MSRPPTAAGAPARTAMREAEEETIPRGQRLRRRFTPGRIALAVLAVLLLLPPFYADTALLQTGLFVFASVVGAIGLNLLSGVAGQLSLGHAFFIAVGAYAYVVLGSPSGDGLSGAGLPSWLAALLAPVVAGAAGLLFSPISARLRGLYLGVASFALVFVGQHVLLSADALTGGYDGRNVPVLSLFGLSFSDAAPVTVFGVPLGQNELLWYLGLVVAGAAWWFARNVVAGRPGRALQAIRDGEVSAAVLGVAVHRDRAAAFVLSAVYAGVGGVLYALTVGRVVPDSFGLAMSVDYLAMVILGGMGAIGGSVVGAVIVSGLPLLLARYTDVLPFLASPGSGGLDASSFARYLYGALVVLLVVFEPDGLAAVVRRVRDRLRRPRPAATDPAPTTGSA